MFSLVASLVAERSSRAVATLPAYRLRWALSPRSPSAPIHRNGELARPRVNPSRDPHGTAGTIPRYDLWLVT